MAFPKINGYIITKKLGSGSYSTVYKAFKKGGAGTMVAIKCINKSSVKYSGAAIDNLVSEIRLMKTLVHPYIVRMYEFTWDERNIYIIMEYCCGGDLSKFIKRYGRLSEKQVLYFLQQLASALKFLREKGVVHMDLKPHNLLLDRAENQRRILKLADFGFAQHTSEKTQRSVRGSPLYMAPELIRNKTYDARCDLWSVGVIMYECLFGRAPYTFKSLEELMEKVTAKVPIEIPSNVVISPGCLALLAGLLQHDPNSRISYEEFFSTEYLALDTMLSKENYEKAVTLIKLAVKQDSSGCLREALDSYCEALRYLVPAANDEPDHMRKAEITEKLNSNRVYRLSYDYLVSYMERAEQIKQHLKHCDGQPVDGSRSFDSCQLRQMVKVWETSRLPQNKVEPTANQIIAGTSAVSKIIPNEKGTVEKPKLALPEKFIVKPPPSSRRFTFKKFFGKKDVRNSTDNDSNIANKEKSPGNESLLENVGCWVT